MDVFSAQTVMEENVMDFVVVIVCILLLFPILVLCMIFLNICHTGNPIYLLLMKMNFS